jgi:hypothetical protein
VNGCQEALFFGFEGAVSDKIVQCAQDKGMLAIIPCKANRKQQRA